MTDTKPFDPTQRCMNCGGLRNEHHRRAPFRCKTRMDVSNWSPWTREAYDLAAAASAAKAMQEQTARTAARTCPFCDKIHMTMVPTVHSNGTSAQELYGQLRVAVAALREAQTLLEQAAPNGRDYYLQGDFALPSAMHSHETRWTQLDVMIKALEEQRDHVQAVIDFKEAQAATQEVR